MFYKYLFTATALTFSLNLGLAAQETNEGPSADELAKQAADRRKNKQKANSAAAQNHYRIALKLYQDHIAADKDTDKTDLKKAREQLITALTYEGQHSKARELLTKVNSALGMPDDETRDLLNRKKKAQTAFTQQQELEVRQRIADSEQLIKEKKYDNAQRKLKSILDVLDFLPYHANANEYRKKINVLIIEAKGKKRAEEQRIKIEQSKQAEDMARATLFKNQELRRNRIQKLTEQADDRYAAHDFRRAIDLYNIILKMDPENTHANKMASLSSANLDEGMITKAKTDYYLNRETRALFDAEGYILQDPHTPITFPDDFPDFTKRRLYYRAKNKASSEEDWKTRLRGVLDRPATTPFESQPLDQIITKLMISYDVIISLDKEIDKEQIIEDIPVVNLSFKQVLEILVSRIEGDGLGWTLKYGTIYIGPQSNFGDDSVIINYDVRDLIAVVNDYTGPKISMIQADASGAKIDVIEPEEEPPSGDDFVELIRNTTGEGNWEDNHSVEYRNGSIVVNNNAKIHEQIEEILSSMRAQRNLQVNIQTRFLRLDILDMDHIGINYDGLAQPPTPPFTNDTVLQNFPANDNINNISNPLGFLSPTNGRDLLRGRLQNFVGLTYQIDGNNNGVALNQGMAFTFEYLNDIQVAGLLRAVSNKRYNNNVTAPMLTCFNTQRANVAVLTQQAYIRDLTAVAQAGAALFDPDIGYIQTGTSLDVRPIVSHDRKYVTLDLRPTIARLDRVDVVASNAVVPGDGIVSGSSQIELPVISFRAVRTTVSVPDRGSLLVGGFATGTEAEDYAGIPFISKIPVLNFFFGSHLKYKQELNDYILVKAMIVSQTQLEEDIFGIN